MLSKPSEEDYHNIPIQDCGDPLVSLSGLSPKITTYPFYYHQKIPHSFQECFLRGGAAVRLKQAAERLPDGLYFVVLDAWRPYEVQRALYEQIQDDFRKQYDEEQVQRELAKFVALPSDNVDRPSPHMTGGAVDITLADRNGWLDMGTEFDEFTEKARADYYEKLTSWTAQEERIRENRRLLTKVMSGVGYAGYEEEWWHFDYGNQRWAMKTRSTPIYKGVKKTP